VQQLRGSQLIIASCIINASVVCSHVSSPHLAALGLSAVYFAGSMMVLAAHSEQILHEMLRMREENEKQRKDAMLVSFALSAKMTKCIRDVYGPPVH